MARNSKRRRSKTKAQRKRDRERNYNRTVRLLRMYRTAATAVLPRFFAPNCCLNGTRVAMEVLRYFDVEVTPVATNAMVFNKIWFNRMEAVGDRDVSTEDVEGWQRDGGWSLAVGPKSEGPGYSAHVIGLVKDVHWFVDSSFGQFSRPQHAINTDTVLVHPYIPEFETGDEIISLVNAEGAVFWYKHLLAERGFESISGFQNHADNHKVTLAVLAAMGHMAAPKV